MEIDIEDFKKAVNQIPHFSITERGEKLILSYDKIKERWEIKVNDIEKVIEKLKSKKVKDETILYDSNSYEALVRFENSRFIFLEFFLEGNFEIKDEINGLTYKHPYPSKEYLIYILTMFQKYDFLPDFSFFRLKNFFKLKDEGEKKERKKGSNSEEFFKVLRFLFPWLYTVKIVSKQSKDIEFFSKLSTAFLFNLSYNLDIAIVDVQFLREIERSSFKKIKRTELNNINPPKHIYNPDLIYYYQIAVSTDSPSLKFLSFYHSIEHFFHDVYNEDLLQVVRDKITNPAFSYKKKKDLEDLIKTIKKKLKFRNGEFTYNEQDALFLVLKKYVNLDNLLRNLNEYDKQLKDYYKNNKVSFSEGGTIDFDSNDYIEIYRQIADRIYKTRNAIVHSKETDKPRYTPFKDDKELFKEIPLIRFISEEVIINSSTIL